MAGIFVSAASLSRITKRRRQILSEQVLQVNVVAGVAPSGLGMEFLAQMQQDIFPSESEAI